jgi:hypothetical protein
MTNDVVTKLQSVPSSEEIIAAIKDFQLWQQDFERSRKAVEDAEKALDAAIVESLKHQPLKWMEGELVKVPEYNRLYYYLNEEFIRIKIPVTEEYLNEGIL